MSKRKLEESNTAPPTEQQVSTRTFPLDIGTADQQVWLVKVPVRKYINIHIGIP